jgi:hypothetical protein
MVKVYLMSGDVVCWYHCIKGKGMSGDCGACRGMKLLEHAMKVVERVFLMRSRKMVEIDEMQCGFMPGKDTVDALFMARMLQERYGRKKRKLHISICVLWIWKRHLIMCQGR